MPRLLFLFVLCPVFLVSAVDESVPVGKDEVVTPDHGRDTTTGRAFEQRIEAALKAAGYEVHGQRQVGTRPNGGKHMVDLVASKGETGILISLKWQQTGGTAEQKIPYEVICLSEALAQNQNAPDATMRYHKAFLVMGGDGWTLRDWYLSGALQKHLPAAKDIELHTVDSFLAKARDGKL